MLESEDIVIQTDGQGNKIEKYLKKQKIGSGGFAKCYILVNTRTQEKLAAKVIESLELRDKSARAKVLKEIELHKQLSHQHIVRFHDHFEFEGRIYILMELCQNNTLKEFIRNRVRITEFEAKVYLQQILSGLQYLHGRNIIHRDIKLGNVFLNLKMQVKIGDFGLSRELKTERERRYTTCGTPNYIAPEILKEQGHAFEADIWAVGIILYTMLVGRPPFESDSVESTYRRIKSNTYEFPKQVPLSAEARHLMASILDPNPKTRISLAQIRSHDFLNRNIQSLPAALPSYTISIPPETKYLRQFVSEANVRLLVYPKKVVDRAEGGDLEKDNKLSRVMSLDKKMLRKLEGLRSDSKEMSSLNRGRYLKQARSPNSSKSSAHNLKSVRSATSASAVCKKDFAEAERLLVKTLKKQDDINQVICYYDVSSKYGIAYLLSNGNFGVIFNDQTSLTVLQPAQEPSPASYVYYQKSPTHLTVLPPALAKKHAILELCEARLAQYRKSNVLIPYASSTYAKKWAPLQQAGFVLKLSNGIMHFFWEGESVTLRGYRWVKWRVDGGQGEGKLGQKQWPEGVAQRMAAVRGFLEANSVETRQRRNLAG